MSQTIKCPSCKAELAANTTVCEWCNFIINQEGDKSIENISSDLEEIIKSMKGIENPTILTSFKKNSKISMPIFTIAFFLLAYKVSAWFAILGIFFLINALLSIFKKSTNPIASIKPLKAEFDEKVRNFQNLYGLNNKYKAQINEEEYTLHLKNNHPNVNLDKKIKIDFKPTTMFGKWDEEELEQLGEDFPNLASEEAFERFAS